MPERRRVNRTEQIQVKYRNFRWRARDGSPILTLTEQIAACTPVSGNPERRARYRKSDQRIQALLEGALELSNEGKSATEIMTELGISDHSD